jgi:hypothetical protein
MSAAKKVARCRKVATTTVDRKGTRRASTFKKLAGGVTDDAARGGHQFWRFAEFQRRSESRVRPCAARGITVCPDTLDLCGGRRHVLARSSMDQRATRSDEWLIYRKATEVRSPILAALWS